MQVESPARIRNVALAGHNDTGKTTLASALLHAAGVTPRFGRVEEKAAPTDFDPEEQERGISIGLATARVPWKGHVVELLDTPGYGIFFSETLFGSPLKADHKTVFAVLSWVIFGLLLGGRLLYGWRGRTALRWTLSGFVMLLFAYVGSRFVLEVLLHRA